MDLMRDRQNQRLRFPLWGTDRGRRGEALPSSALGAVGDGDRLGIRSGSQQRMEDEWWCWRRRRKRRRKRRDVKVGRDGTGRDDVRQVVDVCSIPETFSACFTLC